MGNSFKTKNTKSGFPQHFETQNRGDSRKNFVKFEDNLEKNRGELWRFFLHFQTKSRKIEKIFQSE